MEKGYILNDEAFNSLLKSGKGVRLSDIKDDDTNKKGEHKDDLNFIKMISFAEEHKQEQDCADFLEIAHEVRPFIFTPADIDLPKDNGQGEAIGLPLPCVSLETMGYDMVLELDNGSRVDIHCIVVHASLDGNYKYYLFAMFDEGEGIQKLEKEHIPTSRIVKGLLNRINTEAIGVVKENRPKIRIRGKNRKRRTIKINNIIYVLPKKNKNKFKKEKGDNVDFSESFWQRAHWTYLPNMKNLGKDQNGVRNQKGRTWTTQGQKCKDKGLPTTKIYKVK